ncbi:hypothetical protein [Gemella sp. zg-570]|nr:hypothetical protein [Gemella sp. zg-570]
MNNKFKSMLTLVDRIYQNYGYLKITSHDFKIGDTFEMGAVR